jgi:diguanylate cyclase (GGDEF)-like protein
VTGAGQPSADDAAIEDFAQSWAAEISRVTYVPMRWAAKLVFLTDQTRRLVAAIHTEPFSLAVGYEVGAGLATARFAAPEALATTVRLLHTGLAPLAGLSAAAVDRVGRLVDAVVVGHCRAVRDLSLDEHDGVRSTAVQEREDAEKQLRAEQARARNAALHDPVTGLPNRALFTDRLGHILNQAGRHKRFGLCVIDLDNFPAITDSLGPRVGDLLLTAVAACLAGFAAEHGCLLARLDSAQFALLVEDTAGCDDAVKLADRALALLNRVFTVDGQDLPVRASAGILERATVGAEPVEALRSASSALHWAQHDGGGHWALFDHDRNAAQARRYQVSAAILPALARGQFTLQYQPVIHLGTDVIVTAEALARWHHPKLGAVPPGVFIPLAEQTGAITELGRYLLTQACRDAAAWCHTIPNAPSLSVNLAAQQIQHPGTVGEIATILDHTGLPPSQLQLEITETVALQATPQTLATLHALTKLGIHLAIDDFGTGYANHATLMALPLHTLKLDATLTATLNPTRPDPKAIAIIGNLIDLGHTLGLGVTAEGVTAAQAPLLRNMRCDQGQGYDLGSPTSAAHITAAIATTMR